MISFGKFITKHKYLIIIISVLLLIPSFIGMANTRINYDILTYLPEDIETMQGQDILVNEFGMGAFSMVMVENMDTKDIITLKEKISNVDHVANVIWYDSIMDTSIPMEMLPTNLQEAFNKEDTTLMAVLFDETTSSDGTMEAIEEIRNIADKQCFVSGMSSIVTDTKSLSEKETPIYVLIAVVLSIIVLGVTMDSFFVPVLFMISIGMAILYNFGSNIFLGEISYITKALSAVLQLGVTMDYSIFLLHSYQENKERFPDDKERAMSHAISNTISSVVGSSITTIAGFIALCFMSFTLGKDIGIVMAKGVVFGVISCVTVLPAMVLACDKLITKTSHKPLIPDLGFISKFVTKYYPVFAILFIILLIPAVYGNNHTGVYYNLDESLPEDLPSVIANTKLKEDYNMNTTHMLLVSKEESQKDVSAMLKEIENVDGIEWALGLESIVGPGIPIEMIPDSVKSSLECEDYQLVLKERNDNYEKNNEKINGNCYISYTCSSFNRIFVNTRRKC